MNDKGVNGMISYKCKLLIAVVMLHISSMMMPVTVPSIFTDRLISHVYFQKGDESKLQNIQLRFNDAFQSAYNFINSTKAPCRTWKYKESCLYTTKTRQDCSYPDQTVISKDLQVVLQHQLQPSDWQNGIYIVPFILSNDNIVTSYQDLKGSITGNKGYAGVSHYKYDPDHNSQAWYSAQSGGADVYIAVYDHQWNLITNEASGSKPSPYQVDQYINNQWGNYYPNPVMSPVTSMSLEVTGPKILAADDGYIGNIFHIQAVDDPAQPTDITSQSEVFVVNQSARINIGALVIPKGTIVSPSVGASTFAAPTSSGASSQSGATSTQSGFQFVLKFATAGQSEQLPLSPVPTDNLKILNTALQSSAVTFTVQLSENSSNQYDVVVNAYSASGMILTQTFTNVANSNKQPIQAPDKLTNLSVIYQTNGMNAPQTKDFGVMQEFVVVSENDSRSSGTVLANKETLTALACGFIFEMGAGTGKTETDQYMTMIPVQSTPPTGSAQSYLDLVNTALGAGKNVVFKATLTKGAVNYTATMTAYSVDPPTANSPGTTSTPTPIFTQSMSPVVVTQMGVQGGNVAMSVNGTMTQENIMYQTSNMKQGLLIPNAPEYIFMPESSAYYTTLTGTPTGGGGGGGDETVGGGPSRRRRARRS